jgi:hypothetical protein
MNENPVLERFRKLAADALPPGTVEALSLAQCSLGGSP